MRALVNSRHLAFVLTLSLWFFLASSHMAAAASFTWTGDATNNNWDSVFFTTTNWETGGITTFIPDSNDTVLFNSGGPVGLITVNLNGTRRVISATLQGSAPITLMGSTLELSSGNITASPFSSSVNIQSFVRLLTPGTWDISNAGLTVSGVISQAGFTKTGFGTLVLTGNNTYTGTTTVNQGILRIGSGGTNGSIVSNLANNASVQFNRSNSLTYGGVISGSGTVTKLGGGNLTLTGNSNSPGTLQLNDGNLIIGSGGSSGAYNGNIVNSTNVTFNRSSSFTYSKSISGSGAVTKTGGATLTFTGNNTYSGITIINQGTLNIGSGGTTGSITGNIVNNATLQFNRSNDLTYGGAISGNGTFSKLGAGTLTLTGNNSHTGSKTINGGALQIGDGGTSGSIAGNVTNNGSLIFNRSISHSYSGNISGGGSVTKDGPGTLTLNGLNSYGGGTHLEEGVLSISSDNRLGAISGEVVGDGGALRVTGTHTTTREFVLNSSLQLDVNGGVTYTAAGLFTGTGIVNKVGSGTLVITGNNVEVNNQTISAGVLQVGNGGTSGAITGDTLNNATLTFDRSDDINYGGTISGSGNLIKNGSGKLTLSGNNSYAGTTSINGGTIEIANDDNLGLGEVLINGAALQVTTTHSTDRDFSLPSTSTINVDTATTYTINGHISSTGSLNKTGNGTLALNGVNTYAGGTTVSAGTLMLDSLQAVGVGPLAVQTNSVDVSGKAEVGILGIATPQSITIDSGGMFSTAAGEDLTIGSVGNVALSGGTINSRRLNNRFGGNLSGSGTVNASILSETGSSITATGDLELGDSADVNGFYSNGDLAIESGTTTLHDANTAVFDSAALVTLGDGLGGSGNLAATNGLTLDFGGNITGFGTINTPDDPATPLINNGSITGNSLMDPVEPITITGYMKGVGTCDNCNIIGTDAPGFSPAAVNRGSVSYNGTLEIEIGGTAPGTEFDQLNHILGAGVVDLGGTLDVSLIGGFDPEVGQFFQFISSIGGIFNSFDTVNLPVLDTGKVMNLVYGETIVGLEVVAAFTADFDGDGDVDGNDFLVWQRNPSVGSLSDWQAQYGSVLPLTANANAVPEPTSSLLLTIGICLANCRKRL